MGVKLAFDTQRESTTRMRISVIRMLSKMLSRSTACSPFEGERYWRKRKRHILRTKWLKHLKYISC